MSQLINEDIAHKANDVRQLSLFDNAMQYDEVIRILKDIDVNNITPRHALDILCDLKEKLDK